MIMSNEYQILNQNSTGRVSLIEYIAGLLVIYKIANKRKKLETFAPVLAASQWIVRHGRALSMSGVQRFVTPIEPVEIRLACGRVP